jgi:hypothetical protein
MLHSGGQNVSVSSDTPKEECRSPHSAAPASSQDGNIRPVSLNTHTGKLASNNMARRRARTEMFNGKRRSNIDILHLGTIDTT